MALSRLTETTVELDFSDLSRHNYERIMTMIYNFNSATRSENDKIAKLEENYKFDELVITDCRWKNFNDEMKILHPKHFFCFKL